MIIKLWGVRGSLPIGLSNQELKKKIRTLLQNASCKDIESDSAIEKFINNQPFYLTHTYGGETTCVEVISEQSGARFIIDAGTGIRKLGDKMIREEGYGEGGKDIHILITHTHWDHIQGFPFFVPAYIPNNTIHFYSPYENLKERFVYQQPFEHFPVGLDGMAANKEFNIFKPGSVLEIDDVKITCFQLNHPGGSYAYRFEKSGKVFIFATDVEFTMVQLDNIEDYKPFFQGADLLVLDSQYTLEEAFYKFDWGHTSFSMAVNLGISWKIKKLILTHHDPANKDERLFQIHNEAKDHKKLMNDSEMEIFQAVEGMKIRI